VNEYPRAIKWLYETLTTTPISGVGTVSEHPAPQGSPRPAITYQLQAPDDLTVVGEARIWAEFLMLVTVSDQTESTYSLKAIADEIDARLHGGSGTADDAAIISSLRVSAFHADELSDGVPYRRLGGLYSLLVQPINA
jgi:hypothetical protein